MVNTGDWWKGRWREDVRLPDGTTKYQWSPRVNLLPSTGPFRATRKEAERHFWNAYLSKLDANNLTPHSIETVGGFIESKFDPLHIVYMHRPDWHRALIRNHFPEWFLAMRLRDVRKADVQKVCDAVARHCSPQTVRHVRSRVHKLFTFAQQEDYFTGNNPARGVRLPPLRQKKTRALEYDEARRLLEAIDCRNTKDLATFALLSGCRISELIGLTWKWVNLDSVWHSVAGEVLPEYSAAIVQQWCEDGKLGPLKTESSTRLIPLSRPMAEILNRRRLSSAGPREFVFSGRTGRPLDHRNLASRKLKPAAQSVGMPDVAWHCFRHTLNTWLFQEGMHPFAQMAQLGHKASTTFGVNAKYVHVRIEDRRAVLEKIADELLRSESAPEPTAGDLDQLRGYFK